MILCFRFDYLHKKFQFVGRRVLPVLGNWIDQIGGVLANTKTISALAPILYQKHSLHTNSTKLHLFSSQFAFIFYFFFLFLYFLLFSFIWLPTFNLFSVRGGGRSYMFTLWVTRAALSAEIRKLTGIKFVRGVCFNSAKTFEVRTHIRTHTHTLAHTHARRREFTFTFAHSHSTAEYELHYTIEHKLRLRLPYGKLHCATHSSESVFFFLLGGTQLYPAWGLFARVHLLCLSQAFILDWKCLNEPR